MGRATKANDWEFAGIGSTSASVGVAGAGWVFSFKSTTANVWEDFLFATVGVATPGLSAEVGLPDVKAEDISWSKISAVKPFSANDLNLNVGYLVNGGPSALYIGYSRLYLSAGTVANPLFVLQLNDGYSVGISIEAGGSIGAYAGWYLSLGTVVQHVILPVLKGTLLVVSVGSGLFQAGDALLSGRATAALYKFVEGYARMLALLTSKDKEISNEDFNKYKYLNWSGQFQEASKTYQDSGTRGNYALTYCEEAGAGAILQAVLAYGERYGGDAWGTVRETHRTRYGSDDSRVKKYRDIMIEQVKAGNTIFGIRVDL